MLEDIRADEIKYKFFKVIEMMRIYLFYFIYLFFLVMRI